MGERLIEKLDRLGAEAGIKEMTPEIYRFAQLLNDEKMKQWDEWRANREWAGLTDEETTKVIKSMPRGIRGWMSDWDLYEFSKVYEAKLKEKNT